MIFYAELKTYNLFNHLFSYDDEDYFLKKGQHLSWFVNASGEHYIF